MEQAASFSTGKTSKTPSFDPQKLQHEDSPSKSFAEVFIDHKGTYIPIKKVSNFKGEKAINFTMEEVESLSQPFKFSLIGKFSHGRPRLDDIKKFLKSLGLRDNFSVGDLDKKHIFIRFFHEEDYLRMWTSNNWFIQNYHMRTLKWTYNFKPGYEPPIAPVWISFYMLPIHLYNKSSLFSIASVFGFPLKLDTATSNCTRPNLARICIEVDFSKELTHRLWISYGNKEEEQGFWQECIYEQLPEFCNNCKKVGHKTHDCKLFDDMHHRKEQPEKQRNGLFFTPHGVKNQAYKQGKSKFTQPNKIIKKKESSKWVRKRNNTQNTDMEFPICKKAQEEEHQLPSKETLFMEHYSGVPAKKMPLEITVYNRFNVLNDLEDSTCNYQGTSTTISKENQVISTLRTKEKEIYSEEEFLADQSEFCFAQELAKVKGILSTTSSQIEPIQTAPISVCIRDPDTRQILQIEKLDNQVINPPQKMNPLLIEYPDKEFSEQGKETVNSNFNIQKQSTQEASSELITINDGELTVDIYSSNWETELDEEE